MTEEIMEINDGNFGSKVVKANLPVLIDFWAPWCAPCKMIAPVIEEIASEYKGKLRIGKLNVDENPVTTTNFKVLNIPTLILFNKGEEIERIVGVTSKGEIVTKISRVFGQE
jgi:thioredoxin 1